MKGALEDREGNDVNNGEEHAILKLKILEDLSPRLLHEAYTEDLLAKDINETAIKTSAAGRIKIDILFNLIFSKKSMNMIFTLPVSNGEILLLLTTATLIALIGHRNHHLAASLKLLRSQH